MNNATITRINYNLILTKNLSEMTKESAQQHLLSAIKTFVDNNGTETIRHLNELMHHFTDLNNSISELETLNKQFDIADGVEREDLEMQIFKELDGLTAFYNHYLSDLRFSVNQVNQLTTEVILFNARTRNE